MQRCLQRSPKGILKYIHFYHLETRAIYFCLLKKLNSKLCIIVHTIKDIKSVITRTILKKIP